MCVASPVVKLRAVIPREPAALVIWPTDLLEIRLETVPVEARTLRRPPVLPVNSLAILAPLSIVIVVVVVNSFAIKFLI